MPDFAVTKKNIFQSFFMETPYYTLNLDDCYRTVNARFTQDARTSFYFLWLKNI